MAFLRRYDEDQPFSSFSVPAPEDEPYVPPNTDPGAGFPTGVINPKPDEPTPPVTGSGGKNGGGGGFNPALTGRPQFNFPGLPGFTPPDFVAPTLQDALNEPGYQFRLKGGSDALERSAAARGVLRTGGTLKDIVDYGQNFASQEYGNVYNRALQGFDRKYQGVRDTYAPKLAQWQMLSQAELQAALAQYARQWDMYTFEHRNDGYRSIPPPPEKRDVNSFGSFSW
jgi:hypothetical protein